MVSGILGGEGVAGKPLIKFHDCVVGLVSARGATCVRSYMDLVLMKEQAYWQGCCVLWTLRSGEASRRLCGSVSPQPCIDVVG